MQALRVGRRKRLTETFSLSLCDEVLTLIGSHGKSFKSMTTMPLRRPARSVWKKSRQERALWIGARVGDEQLTQERSLLRCPATIEGEQPLVDQIEVHAFGVPAGIKVTGQ